MATPTEPKTWIDVLTMLGIGTAIGATVRHYVGWLIKRRETASAETIKKIEADTKLEETTLIQQNVLIQSLTATLKDLMEDVDPHIIVRKLEQEIRIKSMEWQHQVLDSHEENVKLRERVKEMTEHIQAQDKIIERLSAENAEFRARIEKLESNGGGAH